MNMQEKIINTALDNLHKHVGVVGTWHNNGPKELDGQTEFVLSKKPVQFYTEIKHELRNHQLLQIIHQATRHSPFLVVANRIFPNIKEQLRQHAIAYLEASGNIYLNYQNHLIWIENNKPPDVAKKKENRAFTKTGLKVVFYFLQNEEAINLPYREIAGQTSVALGNINYVINGLKETGYLVQLTKNEYKLANKKDLLNKWIEAYAEKLKPAIRIGSFRFLNETDGNQWKDMKLPTDKTRWGSEAAGELLTDYLLPAELTLYTAETRSELMKNYRMVPDEKGPVKIYKKFWTYAEAESNTVPPLLVYADLINTHDRRCLETAQKLWDAYLQDTF
jgi:hypothetical protein